jgi:hypothetical protein
MDFIVRRIAQFELASESDVRGAFRYRDDEGHRPAGFYRVRRDVSVVVALCLVIPVGLLLQRIGVPAKGSVDWLEVALIALLVLPIFYYGIRTPFERRLPFSD